MADKQLYPQIPTSIWWGVRDILMSKPSIQLTPKTISVQFSVQETAAKAYVRELQRAGLVDDDGRPTPLALKWRNDETYEVSVGEILKNCYPQELLDALNLNDIDREKAKKWFVLDGMGSGTAGNKAATFSMIASQAPGTVIPNQKKATPTKKPTSAALVDSKINSKPIQKVWREETEAIKSSERGNIMPLNVNVQIHISADSSNEQIEMIFKSMKKYLYHHGD